jgi:hypothetical protein
MDTPIQPTTDNNHFKVAEENGDHSDWPEKPFWQRIMEMGAEVPDEEWQKLPPDFARNAEHYMYGTPRDDEEELPFGLLTT